MAKRQQPAIGRAANEDSEEPTTQRAKIEEPDHLLCPITHVMFRDPVVLMESGHTYERAAIERHLQDHRTDPLTRDRVVTAPVTNRGMRNAVETWLGENPGVVPEGWKTREMLPAQRILFPTHLLYTASHHTPDLEAMFEWRELCPELRDLWQRDDPGRWQGVTWSDGRVTELKLADEGLSGQLPRLEGLTSLEQLDLSGNQLSGTIPAELFESLTSLYFMDLYGNQLSGELPEKLFKSLISLKRVNLSGNELSGSIPEKLFQGLTSLELAYLSGNQLSGPISDKLFDGLASLQQVHMNDNQLTGSIPDKLFKGLTSLREVDLDNNQLSGKIPEKLFEGLTSLEQVHLDNNQLSGTIPEKIFEGLTSLWFVNLKNNELSGERQVGWFSPKIQAQAKKRFIRKLRSKYPFLRFDSDSEGQ